ncbi:hypothetical protein GCM10027592_31820 [Spirosoma flavus]
MNKGVQYLLASVFTFWLSFTAQAQDIIIRKDGSSIKAKVLGTDKTYIRYKRFDNPAGPDYFLYQTDVQTIEYEKKAEPVLPSVIPETQKQIASPATPPVTKPEVPPPASIAVQSATKPSSPVATELLALEKKAAQYKTKSTLGTVLGAGAIVGGIVTIALVKSAHNDYISQLGNTNTAYTDWYRSNYGKEPNGGDLAQPKGLLEFGSPGIYVAAAAGVTGAILVVLGRINAGKYKQAKRELEQRRKQVSMTPFVYSTAQFAGIQVKMTF